MVLCCSQEVVGTAALQTRCLCKACTSHYAAVGMAIALVASCVPIVLTAARLAGER